MFDGLKIETWVILQMIVLITILYTGWYLRKKKPDPPDVDGKPTIKKTTSQEHPDEKVLWFREGQFDAAEILSGEACTVSLRDPPGSIKLLHEWSLSPDFPKLAGFMIGDESRFRRILGVSKDGDNVIYKVGRCVDGQPTTKKATP